MFTNCPLVRRVNVGLTDSIPLQLPVVCLLVLVDSRRQPTASRMTPWWAHPCYVIGLSWLFESDDILLLQCQNQCFVSVTGACTNVKPSEASVKYYHKRKKYFYSYILSSMSEYPYTVLLLVLYLAYTYQDIDGPLGSLISKGIVSLKYHGRRKLVVNSHLIYKYFYHSGQCQSWIVRSHPYLNRVYPGVGMSFTNG